MTRAVAVLAALGLALTGCSSGGKSASGKASATSTPTSTVSVPSGANLTEQGSKLSFGQPATVIFEPTQKRGSTLEVTVKKAAKGSLADLKGFVLEEPYKKKANYYYVHVTVKNIGGGDVGGVPVPLWGVDGDNVLLPAVKFTTAFKRCPSPQLPTKFAAGASLTTCLVFLSPNKGSLVSLSYRPDQAFNPITWTGDVSTPKVEPKKTKKKTKKKG